MVIDKIRKMSGKGVKLKSESFFSISPGVLELWRKTLGGRRIPPPPPGPDRVKLIHNYKLNSRCTVETPVFNGFNLFFFHWYVIFISQETRNEIRRNSNCRAREFQAN